MVEGRSARGTAPPRADTPVRPTAVFSALVVVALLGYLASVGAGCPWCCGADASSKACGDAAGSATSAAVATSHDLTAAGFALAAVPVHLAEPPVAADPVPSGLLHHAPAPPVALLRLAPKLSPPLA